MSQEWTCKKKKRYPTRECAEVTKRLRESKGRGRGLSWKQVNAYLCSSCGSWHLGHASPELRRRYS